MFANIAFGALLTASTVAVHALCTASLIAFLRAMHVDHWALRSVWTRVTVISALVVGMFLVSVVEAGLWSATYVSLGAIPDFSEALYFSVVTFTTLGYGDVTVHDQWRLLASLEAADGTITFGWTTALIVAVSHRIYVGDARS